MYKKGYKHMLGDINSADHNISKFKGGYSIFEVNDLRNQLLSKTDAPVISQTGMKDNLSRVVMSPRINKREDLMTTLKEINDVNSNQ